MTTITLDIELLVFIVMVLVVIAWFVFTFITKQISKWRYKPENDKGKKAEDNRRQLIARDRELKKTINVDAGSSKLADRELLQTTDVDSVGKNSKSTRGFFKTRRRRRR